MATVPGLHVFVVVWSYVEIILFGGLIFGWHSIVYVYKDEGYFSDGCAADNSSVSHGLNISAALSTWGNHTLLDHGLLTNNNSTDVTLTCDERLQQTSDRASSRSCLSQDSQFSLIFTLATVITGILCVLNGYLYDHLGTRFCRCLAIVCYIIAFICLITASPDNPTLLYPGFILLVYAGYIILVTNMQLSSLIPRFRSTLIAMCSGSYDSSAAIFLLFKIAHENGIRVNHSFAFHMILFSIIILSTVFVHKKDRYPWPLPDDYKFQFTVCEHIQKKKQKSLTDSDDNTNWKVNENGSMIFSSQHNINKNPLLIEEYDIKELSTETSGKPLQDPVVQEQNIVAEKQPTILEILKTPLFLWNLQWMCLQRLRSWFFVGMFNPWITRLACGDKATVSQYTSFFAIVQFVGVFSSPLSGRLMDRKVKAANIYKNHRVERLHASIASFVMCSLLSLVFSILVAIPVIQLQYISCILHSLCRSFLYGPNFAFAANAYPIEHFGKVTGVILTVSALFGLMQYPLFLLIQGPLNNDPLVVDIIFIIMMVLSLGHPLYIWNHLRKERKRIQSETHN